MVAPMLLITLTLMRVTQPELSLVPSVCLRLQSIVPDIKEHHPWGKCLVSLPIFASRQDISTVRLFQLFGWHTQLSLEPHRSSSLVTLLALQWRLSQHPSGSRIIPLIALPANHFRNRNDVPARAAKRLYGRCSASRKASVFPIP
jgi:hypothetical protein